MQNLRIRVFNNSSLKYLPKEKVIKAVTKMLESEKVRKAVINIIYVGNAEIKNLNKKFLGHNRTTDVIAFSLSEEKKSIEGEIYIGAQIASKQAEGYKVSLTNEILRLSVHGALHLAGYTDKTDKEREQMHKMENEFIGAV